MPCHAARHLRVGRMTITHVCHLSTKLFSNYLRATALLRKDLPRPGGRLSPGFGRAGARLKEQVERHLKEPWAADGVLNHPQAALRRDRGRPGIVGEEIHIVVGCVEIGLVEDIECVRLETQPEALLDGKLLGQAYIEALLERTSEHVSARAPVQGLVDIAP